MKKLKILIDMDDTIENLIPAWVEWLNKRHKLNVKASDIKSWDIYSYFSTLKKEAVYAPVYKNRFWKTVTPKYDAIKYIKKLIDDGHEIFIVTNSHYKTLKPKMEKVLFKHFPFISWNNVIVTSNKQIIRGDILVDDGIHNLTNGGYIPILFDAPHNAYFNSEINGIKRVYNWYEVYIEVTRLAYEEELTLMNYDSAFRREEK